MDYGNSTFVLTYPPDEIPEAIIGFARLLIEEEAWEKARDKGKVPKPKIERTVGGLKVIQVLLRCIEIRREAYTYSLKVRVGASNVVPNIASLTSAPFPSIAGRPRLVSDPRQGHDGSLPLHGPRGANGRRSSTERSRNRSLGTKEGPRTGIECRWRETQG
jgi:hypothetical protein